MVRFSISKAKTKIVFSQPLFRVVYLVLLNDLRIAWQASGPVLVGYTGLVRRSLPVHPITINVMGNPVFVGPDSDVIQS